MSPRVVIVGAGYAGVSAAKRLARSDADVTLVNPRAEFVERIRLHQFVAGNHAASVPLTSLLPSSTSFVQGSATTINAQHQQVTLAGGDALRYDYLIYAPGSRSGLDVIPGGDRHAVTVGSMENAVATRQRLRHLPAGSTVTVVGGGLTGVELAAELAELAIHRIRIVTDDLLAPSVSGKGREYLRRRLGTLGVELLEQTPASEIDEGNVVLSDGRALATDLCVMAATFTRPTLAADSGLDVDPDNALRVDDGLVSTGDRAIIGAGDACRVQRGPLRMSCQVAVPLGAHAAETALRLDGGRAPKPLRPKFTGQCISLGRTAGLWQSSNLADRPRSLVMTGKPAARLKEQVCAGTTRIALNPRVGWLRYTWS